MRRAYISNAYLSAEIYEGNRPHPLSPDAFNAIFHFSIISNWQPVSVTQRGK